MVFLISFIYFKVGSVVSKIKVRDHDDDDVDFAIEASQASALQVKISIFKIFQTSKSIHILGSKFQRCVRIFHYSKERK